MKWGPTILQEMKHMSQVRAGWLGFGSEIAGLCSALLGGLIADRIFGGRAGRVCCIAMLIIMGAIYLFWKTAADSPTRASILFILMGFCVYIPQMLIAAMAMNLGTKRAAAAAVGLTGILGYGGTVMSGWGMGKLHDLHNRWDESLVVMIGCAAGTLVLMAFTWNVGAHPHSSDVDNASTAS
jgi:OPA family glycerol-3-phosphate transporter-like MFS transporter/OPA family sugar phosphate sensor protein UhpC-like MFS transporter